MCYFLYLATPLTLSEVRSMLPSGLRADAVSKSEQGMLLQHHPEAQTVVQIVRGACSCDLVRARKPVTREDEAHLRTRYRQLGLPRDQVIVALENHRRAVEQRPRPEGYWPEAINGFVLEHARNAGPSLYFLGFSYHGALEIPRPVAPPVAVAPGEISTAPTTWLVENQLTVVTRPPRT
ncbi:MAG: hypothetical protein ABI836_04225 [Gemmatimonadota bacterium]